MAPTGSAAAGPGIGALVHGAALAIVTEILDIALMPLTTTQNCDDCVQNFKNYTQKQETLAFSQFCGERVYTLCVYMHLQVF